MKFLEKVYDYFLGRDVAYFIGGATFYISLSMIYPNLLNFSLNSFKENWQIFVITFIFWHITGVITQEILIITNYLLNLEGIRMTPFPISFVIEEHTRHMYNSSIVSMGERLVFLKHLAYDLFSTSTIVLTLLLGKIVFTILSLEQYLKTFYLTSLIIFVIWGTLWIDGTKKNQPNSKTNGNRNIIQYWNNLKNFIDKPCQLYQELKTIRLDLIEQLSNVAIHPSYHLPIITIAWIFIIFDGIALEILNSTNENVIYPISTILQSLIMWGIIIARRFLIYEELIRVNTVETMLSKQFQDLLRCKIKK